MVSADKMVERAHEVIGRGREQRAGIHRGFLRLHLDPPDAIEQFLTNLGFLLPWHASGPICIILSALTAAVGVPDTPPQEQTVAMGGTSPRRAGDLTALVWAGAGSRMVAGPLT